MLEQSSTGVGLGGVSFTCLYRTSVLESYRKSGHCSHASPTLGASGIFEVLLTHVAPCGASCILSSRASWRARFRASPQLESRLIISRSLSTNDMAAKYGTTDLRARPQNRRHQRNGRHQHGAAQINSILRPGTTRTASHGETARTRRSPPSTCRPPRRSSTASRHSTHQRAPRRQHGTITPMAHTAVADDWVVDQDPLSSPALWSSSYRRDCWKTPSRHHYGRPCPTCSGY